MQIPVYHVDAFAGQPFRGNPAAVCPLDSWLDDGMLRKVAAENNLSATAFFVQKDETYELRWFTPVCEIRFCGHATLATGYVILNALQPEVEEPGRRMGRPPHVRFTTRFAGLLAVRKDGDQYFVDFPALHPTRIEAPASLIGALGSEFPPIEVFEANDTLFCVFDQQNFVEGFRPDFGRLELLHPRTVAITAPGNDADFVSRYFAPSYGVPEDPVTGSAHCALAPYWAGRLGKSRLRAQQLSERGGELSCELAGDRVILRAGVVLTMQAILTI